MKFHFLDEVYVISGFYKGARGHVKNINKDLYTIEDNRSGQDINIKEGSLVSRYKSKPYLQQEAKEIERKLRLKKEREDYDKLPWYKKILTTNPRYTSGECFSSEDFIR